MNTETTQITDERRTVFIEVRERGAESVICKNNQGALHALGIKDKYIRHRSINFGRDVLNAKFIEVFAARQGTIHFKKCSFPNVSTPYSLILGNPNEHHEVFMSTGQFAVVTNFQLRSAFTKDVYELSKLDNPMYKVSALTVMEQLFFMLAITGKIEREIAKKRFDKYDKVKARIWRGSTPGEQINAFTAAFNLLAKVCNLQTDERTM